MKITILPHPEDIIDVDPKILENFKNTLNSAPLSEEEIQASEDQDYLER